MRSNCKSNDEGSSPFSGFNILFFELGYDGKVDMLDSKFNAEKHEGSISLYPYKKILIILRN